jgi:hypothetical protein
MRAANVSDAPLKLSHEKGSCGSFRFLILRMSLSEAAACFRKTRARRFQTGKGLGQVASRQIVSLAAYLPFVVLAFSFPLVFGGRPALAEGEVLPVKAMPVTEFQSGAGKVFGKLEFLGGLSMATPNGEMGAVSSIRVTDGGAKFISVMDTGHWATGTIERDAAGRLSGVGDYRIYDMLDRYGDTGRKYYLDAESMVLTPDKVYVGYEGDHRIDAYPRPGFETSKPIDTQRPVLKIGRLKSNGSLEALLKAPDAGPLAGALFYVAERSYDRDGNFISGVQSGPLKGNFAVERIAPYDITDGVVLDDGSFLLLERKFGLASGIGMRIRRFQLSDIKPGAILKGDILIEASFPAQIDNMEGLDAFNAKDGSTHLIVVSDDNHNLLERNLMLEFKLLP